MWGCFMLSIDVLKDFGANVDEGLERCLGEEDFYLELIPSTLEEGYYKGLEDAINLKDLHAAFEAAHALKGLLANLALTPILTPVSEMTELLRDNQDTDYTKLLSQMWEQRNRLLKMME